MYLMILNQGSEIVYNKKKILVFSIILIGILFLVFYNYNKKEPEVETLDKPKLETIKKTIESRRVEVRIADKYVVDRDKMSFKTDDNGLLEVTHILTHNTLKEEEINLYAFLEDDNTPILIELNGNQSQTHLIKVPKEGEVESNLILKGLPPGDHIIYFVSEKNLKTDVNDDLEIRQTQAAISKNYFSLHVPNKTEVPSDNNTTLFKTIEKEEDLKTKGPISLELYEDEEQLVEASDIKQDEYFLIIKNTREYGFNARINLISDFKTENIENITIEKDSITKLPITLKDIGETNSLRIVFIGEPTVDLNAPYPVREMQFTERLNVID